MAGPIPRFHGKGRNAIKIKEFPNSQPNHGVKSDGNITPEDWGGQMLYFFLCGVGPLC